MKPRQLEAIAKTLAPILREYVAEATKGLQPVDHSDAIKALEDKVDAIEFPVIDLEDLAKQAADLVPAPERGEKGEAGEKGDPGAPGKDGRDALQQIDPASIERVIRKEVERLTPRVEIDGRRGLVITIPKAEGEPEIIRHDFKNFEWQGVWKDTETYLPGDVVTWNGSAWHCEEETKGDTPGATPVWKLCVKRGRDA